MEVSVPRIHIHVNGTTINYPDARPLRDDRPDDAADGQDGTASDRRTYDRTARRYADRQVRPSPGTTHRLADLEHRFVDRPPDGGVVADEGCGPAFDGLRPAGRGPAVATGRVVRSESVVHGRRRWWTVFATPVGTVAGVRSRHGPASVPRTGPRPLVRPSGPTYPDHAGRCRRHRRPTGGVDPRVRRASACDEHDDS